MTFNSDIHSFFNGKKLHALPDIVIHDLAKSLNNPGPSNWKVLQRNIDNIDFSIFGQEDYEELAQHPAHNSIPFLHLLCQRHVTVGFLLQCLKTLPCPCSWDTFTEHLGRIFYAESDTSKHMATGFSLPVFSAYNYHNPNMHQMSLPQMPSNHHLTNGIQITTQPNDIYKLKQGEDIVVKCLGDSPLGGLSYQWFHMFTPLPNQTTTVLMIPDATLQHQGYYCCQIKTNTPHPVVVKSKWTFISIGVDDSEFFATDKVALLIANERYANHKRLPATARDVQVLTDILQNELNFKTLSFVNLSFSEIHKALQWMCEMCREGCYCVFYFGGHGFESDGMCHIVPTDAPSPFKNNDCINIFRELENIQRRRMPKLMLILSDICRKRNPEDHSYTQTESTFHGNVVLAYATTGTREAFEMKGVTHGIFVEALHKHLAKPERVNHMLSRMQDEVGKSRRQVAEVKSMLVENRCLTDRIIPDNVFVTSQSKWLYWHEKIKNEVRITQVGSKATVEFQYKSLLTNKFLISVRVLNCKNGFTCGAHIDPSCFRGVDDVMVSTPTGQDVPPDSFRLCNVLEVSNLQKLKEGLTITVVLQYQSHETGRLSNRSYREELKPKFIPFWRMLAPNSELH